MYQIEGHSWEGRTLVLHLSIDKVEFGQDIETTDSKSTGWLASVKSYVKEHLPGQGSESVKVMLGPLMLANLPADTLGMRMPLSQHKAKLTNLHYRWGRSSDRMDMAEDFGVDLHVLEGATENELITIPVQLYQRPYQLPVKQEWTFTFRESGMTREIRQRMSKCPLREEMKILPDTRKLRLMYQLPYEVRLGDRNTGVEALQEAFHVCGLQCPVTGTFDEATAAACEDWKASSGFSHTGVAFGPIHRDAMIQRLLQTAVHLKGNEPTPLLVNSWNRLERTAKPTDLIKLGVDITGEHWLTSQTAHALHRWMEEARKRGLQMTLQKAYRSGDIQHLAYREALTRNKMTPCKAPGESEHQTGEAIDIMPLDEEDKGWIQATAARHGFTLRYPEGKEAWTGQPGEAWHFRYVGKDIADVLKQNNWVLEQWWLYQVFGREPFNDL
ncbi:D-alanyl-D-alanine carboxypeptidase family protein [Aureibacillus halotolerans]|uniref:LAS superfamily LD-carboxypeptidase LdcB n=1 Tax=Aureibacillus halotolerans TaxID=1508390 RepID=A0A4R6TR18_9BACI|nr:M15 family metallopeptidase [Aureibacillus halotolerans]TDQ35429.1 LAS superfamily LD-carboxypeptidase LdcB [Aureibacillus halotolerans]